MFSVRNALLAVVPCLVVGAASASVVGFLAYAQLKTERAEHRSELLAIQLGAANGALQELDGLAENMRHVAGVVGELQKEAHANAQTLQAGIAGLRSDTAGLRRESAELPQLLAGLTRSTVERYASTCARLFADLADEGTEMAAEGAAIASSAQGHYLDDRAKGMSWPAPSRSTSATKKEKSYEHTTE